MYLATYLIIIGSYLIRIDLYQLFIENKLMSNLLDQNHQMLVSNSTFLWGYEYAITPRKKKYIH